MKLGVVRSGFLVKNLLMPHSVIVHEFFNRAQPHKALLLYADCMTMSGTHRIILSQRPNTIMVRRTQEAVLFVTEDKHKHDCMHSLSNPIFGLGQSECGVTMRHIGRTENCDCVH